MLQLAKLIRRQLPDYVGTIVRILTINGLLLFVAGLMTVFGCSNKQMYENIQYEQKLRCQKLPESEYEQCMEKVAQSYEDYKSARDEAFDQE